MSKSSHAQMVARWKTILETCNMLFDIDDAVPYTYAEQLKKKGITRRNLDNAFSNRKKYGGSSAYDEAAKQFNISKTEHNTSFSSSVVAHGNPTNSNNETNDICDAKNKGVSSNCKCCASNSSSGDQTSLCRASAAQHIQIGTCVDIERSDGRIHDAFVYEKFNCRVTVRWFEPEAGACVPKIKNICVEDLIVLNPELTEKAAGLGSKM